MDAYFVSITPDATDPEESDSEVHRLGSHGGADSTYLSRLTDLLRQDV